MSGRWRQAFVCAFATCSLLSLTLHAAPTDTNLLFSEQSDGSVDFLEIDVTPALDLTGGAFTLSAWINPSGWGDNNQGRILDHGGGSGASEGWSFHIENNGRAGSPQALRIQINKQRNFRAMSDTDAITLGVWQHVAVTVEEQVVTFYVDGVLAGTVTNAPTVIPSAVPVRIGARATDFARGFDGRIDDVRIYDRALSQGEIQASMNIDLVGDEVGLVAYYRMDEGSGQTVADLTGNGQDARLGSSTAIDANDPAWETTAASNLPPTVDAGADQIIILPVDTVTLDGSVTDDDFPGNPLTVTWSVDSGPGTVTFSDATSVASTASFSDAGTYVLRLSVDDGEFAVADTVTITVDAASVLTSIVVTPNVASMSFGETQQFSAEGRDQRDAAMPVSPSWSTTGGSIDGSGLYTAGDVTGTYSVLATDGSVVGTATVVNFDASDTWPTLGWEVATAADLNMDEALLTEARDFALTGGGSGIITRSGKSVMTWGDQAALYDLKSTTKSIGTIVLGLALQDLLLQIDDFADQYLPGIGVPPDTNSATGWLDDITILHLATHVAGFDKLGGYTELLFEPGTFWSYSDGGPNWLADLLTVLYGVDLQDLLFSRVFGLLGIQQADLTWRDNAFREQVINGIPRREFGSGISANVDAMARIGYLYLRNGVWEGQAVLPASFVQQAANPVPGIAGLPELNSVGFLDAADHYGLLWWNNGDGTLADVPTDAFWSWGLNESLIVVIPSLDIVVARAGGGWRSGWDADYSVIEPFITPIALSATPAPANEAPVVDAGVDQTITLPTDTVSLDATVTDDGLPAGSVSTLWTLVSGPGPVVFGDATAVDTTAMFTVEGDYILQLSADDGELNANASVLVTIQAAQDLVPPSVALNAPTEGSTLADLVLISATASDDVALDTVSLLVDGTPLVTLTAAPFEVSWDTTAYADGPYQVTATATDTSANTASVSVNVIVQNVVVNTAPVVDAGADEVITLPTDTVSLDATVTDDGLPGAGVTALWSVLSGPAAVVFADETAIDTTATFTLEGSYVLQLTADDGELSGSDTLSVEVQAPPDNVPPTVDLITPAEGSTLTDLVLISATASDDVALDSVSLLVDGTPLVTLTAAPFEVNWDTTAYADGPYQVTATATDGAGNSASAMVSVVVQNTPPVNTAPVVEAGLDQTIILPVDTVSLDGTVTDDGLPGSGTTTLWSVVSGPSTVAFGDETAVDTSATFSVEGDYVLQLSADDGELTGSDTVSITLTTQAPSLTLISPADGATVTGWLKPSADVTDDFGIMSVEFTVDGNEVATLTAPPYEFDWDSNALTSGVHSMTVTATDTSNIQTSVSSTIYVDSLPTQPSTYPMSAVITGVEWAPVATISRAAIGSDNWPITWADDGELYTAYGDGFGFDPPAPQKLSLGFARVDGPATAFAGQNIPSPTGEHFGDGPSGKKASGLLMVDGTLYAWVRNANNSGEQCELAWSSDYGSTWTWGSWQFAEFGYCAFLNFGQNYAGAPDSFVYMYTPDTPSAYNETDNVILTRVPRHQITDRSAYEFFGGVDASGDPIWNTDIALRQPVFTFAGGANRLDVTYQPILGRYLMTMRSRAQVGGLNQFSIFEGKNPWGPWSVVFYTEDWEGVPASNDHSNWGEAQHIPSKWMSTDGREIHLVFSGDDSFSVRNARMTIVPDTNPPTVSLTAPTDGSDIAGVVTIAAAASDDYAVSSVAFEFDGMPIAEMFGPPYSFDWDSGSVAEGTHDLTALATDTSGNQSSASITVNVFRDTLPPTLTLDTPIEGSVVAGVVPIAATASDDVALASVSFSLDGTLLAVVPGAPYEVSWDSTLYAEGAHQITATATDTSGNTADAIVNVVVQNIVNTQPVVDAGPDQIITLPTDTVSIDATVTDDGLPGSGVTVLWTVLSGPAAVVFDDDAAVDVMATFTIAGDYELQLSADDGELNASDTVNVTVQAAPVLNTLSVTPATVTLAPDESQLFSASGIDQYGNPISVDPTWTATGGTIDTSGLFVAGVVAGDFQVTATDGAVSAQAAVQVSSVATPMAAYLEFDGTDDLVIVADDASLDITAAITLEAWIRPDTLSNSKAQDRVIHKLRDYELTVSTGDTGCSFGTNGDVQWRATIDGQNARICGGVLTPGVWHHIAGTYDGNDFVLYVDGLAVASAARSGSIRTNTSALYLGNRSTADRSFDGAIDEVRIWNKALAVSEIAANSSTELTGAEEGLVAYFRLNDGTDQSASDATVFGNDGTLGSSPDPDNNDPQWVSP